MEEAISLQEVVKILRKRLLLIISLTIMSAGIAVGISFYILTPVYQAKTQILVNQNNSMNESYTWENTQMDLQLINTYNGIITSPVILNPVIEELKLNISPEFLMEQIIVTNESDSKIVNITVLDSNPQQAVNISNTVAEVFKEEVPKLMNVNNINIISVAKMVEDPTPVKPNKLMNIAAATVIGLMLGIGLAFLLEFLDTTIKSEQDVEDAVGLPIMGVIGAIAKEKKSRFFFKSHRVRRE